jgi:hypothetical protein
MYGYNSVYSYGAYPAYGYGSGYASSIYSYSSGYGGYGYGSGYYVRRGYGGGYYC